MASELDIRVKTPTEISRLLGVAKMSVYRIGNKDNIERKRGSGSKAKVHLQVIKKALEAEPLKSMRAHAKDMGISHTTIVRSVKMLGEKSLVRVERPLLTERIKAVHLQLQQLAASSSSPMKKTWTVDPALNRRNDRYLSFGEIDKSARTLTTTNHPASAMSLGFVASNGIAEPLIWFPTGFRLKAADYINVPKVKFLPWVREDFPDGNVVFQQDGVPAHTALTAQNWLKKHVEFWPKDMWPPYSPDTNPLDYLLPHVKSKACTLRHVNFEATKASINEHWTSMSKEYIIKTCQALRRRLEVFVIANGGYIDD
ncbi:Putative transposable element [Caligus rogercresseyi]|uniref:Transposable element n=1 Tax=Caligus rogercresseyi TaxID=217165 RepID=A0A7T8JYJ5_CALRO|nr:Putative transposable element [Caligus rogercresseyi]